MNKIVLLLCLLVLLAGCSEKFVDEYAAYRTKSEPDIFNHAEKALAQGDYPKAAKSFEALDAIYPFGPHSRQAQLDIIYAYYREGDDASSLAAAERFIHLHPRDKNVDYAFYMRGITGFRFGLSWLQKAVNVDPSSRDISNLQQSYSAFANLYQMYPHSIYAPDALLRMAYIRNLMAKREVEVAQFYYARDAYVAAINRANGVVQHYEGSPEVIGALVVMIKSYRALGLTHLANNSYKVLATNYPFAIDKYRLGRG